MAAPRRRCAWRCPAARSSTASTGNDDPDRVAVAPHRRSETPYDSQFTRDGTFQSHIEIDGLDFVYTLYPTKSTPRTNEWYPKGNKFFSFTFQAYDLTARSATRSRPSARSTSTASRSPRRPRPPTAARPSTPTASTPTPKNVTFDPEPLTTKYGMLITSPKGAFELRNQTIKPTAAGHHRAST